MNIKPNTNDIKKYKYIIILAMFYTITFISPILLAYRQVQLGPLFLPGGTVVFASSFIFGDIVSEIYGYQVARLMVVFAIIAQAILALSVIIVIHLPTPPNWHNNSDYLLVFGHVMRYSIASLLGNLLGEFANIMLISKWRVTLQGKLFWMRSIASSAIGELILTATVFFITFFDITPGKSVFYLILYGYTYKIIMSIIVSLPANIFVNYLKLQFGDSPIIGLNYNPFSEESYKKHNHL